LPPTKIRSSAGLFDYYRYSKEHASSWSVKLNELYAFIMDRFMAFSGGALLLEMAIEKIAKGKFVKPSSRQEGNKTPEGINARPELVVLRCVRSASEAQSLLHAAKPASPRSSWW
jgi:hypothetical protein